MKSIEKFGEEIRSARFNLGLSRTELERKTGISLKSISAYEIGTQIPKLKYFLRLAEVLDIDFDEWEPVITEYHRRKNSNLDGKVFDKKKRKLKAGVRSIQDICKEASGMGMTYGQYVALQERNAIWA